MGKKDKKQNTSKIMAFIIAFLMVASVLAVMFSGINHQESPELVEYSGFSFYPKDRGWSIRYNRQDISVDYFPTEVENIKFSEDAKEMLKNSEIIILSFDPDSQIISGISYLRLELPNQVSKIKEIYFPGALLEENNQINLPVFRCENSTDAMPVVKLSQDEKTEIIKKDNCIQITAQSNVDMARVKDRLIYFYLGVDINEEEIEQE